VLILGGILDFQAESVLTAAKKAGLEQIDTLVEQDWVALVLCKPSSLLVANDHQRH